MAKKRLFLFAGEASGDLHGSRLIQALQKDQPDMQLCGVGGPRMRQEAFECHVEMENFQVMGFSDVLKSIRRLWKLFYQILDLILQTQPDAVILIDYPGFNLRLARALRKRGYQGKLIQFICPTVWAHGKGRIKTLAANYDLLLTIYPFEVSYFSETKLKVSYIGNPLVETIQKYDYTTDWKATCGIPQNREVIALFPGSRLGEIQRHVPQQLKAAALLSAQHPEFVFALSCAHENLHPTLINLVEQGPLVLNEDVFIVPPSEHYDLMKHAKAALAKSGTVTLELALHATPSVIHYELTFLDELVARYFLRLKLPHYCIVNILAGTTLFPEMMGRSISPNDLNKHLEDLLFDPSKRKATIAGCDDIRKLLGDRSAHQNGANAILEMMSC